MTFFDCVYFRVNKFYWKEEGKFSGFNGLSVLALMQGFNIFGLFLVICIILRQSPHIPSWSVVLLFIALIFANGIRYYRIDFSIFQGKWDRMDERRRSMLNRMVSIYIAGSTIVCLILTIYVGDKSIYNWQKVTMTLYRPVGPKELKLIERSGWMRFPPRLPEQPIFYPVMNEQYAIQVAHDWNVPASGSGFVTKFEVRTWMSFMKGSKGNT